MQFAPRKRRGPPSVIIVSLIDVLIVVLIFLMVTTSFKHRAPFKVALADSANAARSSGSSPNTATVSISKDGQVSFEAIPMIFDKLEQRLKQAAAANTNLTVMIKADAEAPWGKVLKIIDVGRAANIKVNVAVDHKQAP